MITSVAIVGCGWFGTPLAKFLLDKNLKVFGSKRTPQGADALSEDGIHGFALDLDDTCAFNDSTSQSEQLNKTQQALWQDALIVNIPPGLRSGKSDYLERLQKLKTLIGDHQYQRVVFVSTTGVYAADGRCHDETSASAYDDKSQTLLAAEQLFLDYSCCTVLRFAGLVGPKRAPGRFFAGKRDIAGANLSVNMTHLDDCIGATYQVLQAQHSANNIFNVCAEQHPTKQAFYFAATQKLGLPAPAFAVDNDASLDKTVCGQKIVNELNYRYHYLDPMVMLEHC
ncbi:SDR family oxidoreductase [Shewanella sp. Scap07]|uniref:SDR family oxidoreductase n=1 Tax=Shewanella sp. Scap07 TaxID=2589987 RepID=UPI0015BADC5A|nr:SDR family oxidoreductase [Shewanella sp. Scap07]QLE85107.1 SDR family oxidoreductase [Shewanella sp. Scap07]